MAENSSAIKLHYFDLGGRAETTRLCLTLAGIQFEDIRYTGEQFREKKAAGDWKFGQVPILELNGKQYAQSTALENWSSKQAGLFPTDLTEGLQCDEARGLLGDLQGKLMPSFYEQDAAKKLELRKVYSETHFPVFAAWAEKLLEDNGSGFFAGNQLSVADLNWYVFICWHRMGVLDGVPTDIFTQYTRLNALFETINNMEKVKAWNEAHEKKQ